MMRITGSGRSSGYTLIELLIVIVIIGLLVGLLVPAIGAAVKAAKNASVTAEINTMAQALADFRSKTGDYPPSRVLLVENGDYSATNLPPAAFTYATANSTDQPTGALVQRSMSVLRKLFPKLELSTQGPTRGPGSVAFLGGDKTWWDYNGNGTIDGPRVLAGDEALVFFLGGQPAKVVTTGATSWSVTGFNRDARNPFLTADIAPSRTPQYFEFRASRLVDIDGDGYPSYVDSLGTGRPYAYFSAYGGAGYDPNDVNFDAGNPLVESGEAVATSPITLTFRATVPTNGGSATTGYTLTSPSPNPYTVTTSDARPVIWQNAQSFQILSAGADGQYGVGGQYTPAATAALPFDSANTAPAADVGLRAKESDNLTSFATGKLD